MAFTIQNNTRTQNFMAFALLVVFGYLFRLLGSPHPPKILQLYLCFSLRIILPDKKYQKIKEKQCSENVE